MGTLDDKLDPLYPPGTGRRKRLDKAPWYCCGLGAMGVLAGIFALRQGQWVVGPVLSLLFLSAMASAIVGHVRRLFWPLALGLIIVMAGIFTMPYVLTLE